MTNIQGTICSTKNIIKDMEKSHKNRNMKNMKKTWNMKNRNMKSYEMWFHSQEMKKQINNIKSKIIDKAIEKNTIYHRALEEEKPNNELN